MKSYLLSLLFAAVPFLVSVSPALAYTHHTPPLQPELFASDAASFHLAKTWFLPDFQVGFANRVTTPDVPDNNNNDDFCQPYQACSAVPPNMSCGKSQNIGGNSCYKDCRCNSPEYRLVTESDPCAGCQPRECREAGLFDRPQTGMICEAQTYAGRGCYACRNDPCYNLQNQTCPFGCQKTYDQCPAKCETCYPDNCHNRSAAATPYGCEKFWNDCAEKCEKPYADNCRNRADNATDYGCDKYWSDCPTKCETGKLCRKNDCSLFPLTSPPANTVYDTCTPGCGDETPRYKTLACQEGYAEAQSFWCAVPVTDCAALGYGTETCTGHRILCPFDPAKYICLSD